MEDSPPDQPILQPAPTEPLSESTPTNGVAPIPVADVHKNNRHTFRWFGLLLLLLAVGIAAGVYYSSHHHKAAVSTKKDIPYLTYGTDESADLTQAYPTETADTPTTTQLNTQLFEGLVRYEQVTKIVPDLATTWSNPDSTTWIFTLRTDVKFNDGKLMTADDVKYSLDYATAHQDDNNSATLLSLASTIKQVDVANPNQIKITTNGPDPVLLNRLAYLYIMDAKAKIGDPTSGTGPYTVKTGSKPTADTINLVANNDYWGGHVYTREVHMQVVGTNDQLATDTNNGKYDIAGDFTSQQLTKIAHYKPITVQGFDINFLSLNTLRTGSPLNNLAARQAAQYAMDIPAIIKAGGLSGTPANQLIPLAILGHDPSIKSVPYNPTKAKQLLATVPNASKPLTLSFPTGDEGQVNEIAKELNAVGFNVKTVPIADIDTLVNIGLNGQTDMFYLGDSSTTLDGLALINDIITAAKPDYDNPTIDKLADQASTTINPAERIALLQKIAQQIAADVPVIPLFNDTRTVTLTKPYHVQVAMPSIDAGIYFWQIYQ